MTDDEREAGRWQGGVDERLAGVIRRVDRLDVELKGADREIDEIRQRLGDVENRSRLMWSGLIALVFMVVTAIFNIWAQGGF